MSKIEIHSILEEMNKLSVILIGLILLNNGCIDNPICLDVNLNKGFCDVKWKDVNIQSIAVIDQCSKNQLMGIALKDGELGNSNIVFKDINKEFYNFVGSETAIRKSNCDSLEIIIKCRNVGEGRFYSFHAVLSSNDKRFTQELCSLKY